MSIATHRQPQPARFAMQPAGAFLKRCADGRDDEFETDDALRSIEAIGMGSSFEQELLALAKLQQVQGPLQPAHAQETDAGAAFLESIRRGLDDLTRNGDDDDDSEDSDDEDDDDDDDEGSYYQSSTGNTYYYVPDDKVAKAPPSLDLSNTSTASASSGSFASSQAPCASPARQAEDELIFELEI